MSGETPSSSSTRASKVVEGPFEGKYGTWYLTQGDVDGVLTYRLCLLGMALATTGATTLAVTSGAQAPSQVYDALALAAALAFGGALQTIHIYVRPLHNALKALWALGLLGGIALAASPLTGGAGVTQSVYAHPALMLAVGWQFVALTGLFIKEALCFGRTEALLAIALVPILSGGHFLQVLPGGAEQFGAVAFASVFLFFAARKFQQPATDDIGDMSVHRHVASGGSL